MSWGFKRNSEVLFVLKAVFQTHTGPQRSGVWLTGSIQLIAQINAGINELTVADLILWSWPVPVTFPSSEVPTQYKTVAEYSWVQGTGEHTRAVSQHHNCHLLHYPSSRSRQSFYCTRAPAAEPRTAKASFHSFYFQKKDISKIVCILVPPCQKGIQIHCLHNKYPPVTR